jgi:hypothetical protein
MVHGVARDCPNAIGVQREARRADGNCLTAFAVKSEFRRADRGCLTAFGGKRRFIELTMSETV